MIVLVIAYPSIVVGCQALLLVDHGTVMAQLLNLVAISFYYATAVML